MLGLQESITQLEQTSSSFSGQNRLKSYIKLTVHKACLDGLGLIAIIQQQEADIAQLKSQLDKQFQICSKNYVFQASRQNDLVAELRAKVSQLETRIIQLKADKMKTELVALCGQEIIHLKQLIAKRANQVNPENAFFQKERDLIEAQLKRSFQDQLKKKNQLQKKLIMTQAQLNNKVLQLRSYQVIKQQRDLQMLQLGKQVAWLKKQLFSLQSQKQQKKYANRVSRQYQHNVKAERCGIVQIFSTQQIQLLRNHFQSICNAKRKPSGLQSKWVQTKNQSRYKLGFFYQVIDVTVESRRWRRFSTSQLDSSPNLNYLREPFPIKILPDSSQHYSTKISKLMRQNSFN